MPAPARTTTDAVVAAARTVVDREGIGALTMQAVADAVGVRAPSLYKRVPGRDALIGLVVDQVALELTAALDDAVDGTDPGQDLRALLNAFRAYALRNQETYSLLFEPRHGHMSEDVRNRSSDAVRRVAEALVGEPHALSAARLVTAWAHGFVTMELAGAFQLGGDVEEAWRFGSDRLVAALVPPRRSG